MSGQLGCVMEADGYQVELVFVQVEDGTGDPLPAPVQWGKEILQGVTRIIYGRTVNGVSQATVTVGGPAGQGICCDQVAKIQPEMYEIRILRHGEEVWSGPIVDDVETSQAAPFEIHARDPLKWIDGDSGHPNLVDINYDDDDPTFIARRILERNLTNGIVLPDDYPMVLDQLYIEEVGEVIDYKPRLKVVPILSLLVELTDLGLTYTAFGHKIYLIKGADLDTPPMAQLTQDDFDAPVQVTQDGAEMGTMGVAIRPGDEQDDPPDLFFYGEKSSPYRPHFRLVDVDKEVKNSSATKAARNAIRGRKVPPLIVSMGSSARLYPTAPIQLNELIPGWTRVDFLTVGRGASGICTPLHQPAQVSSVDVDWVPGQERVKIGLIPVGEPFLLP